MESIAYGSVRKSYIRGGKGFWEQRARGREQGARGRELGGVRREQGGGSWEKGGGREQLPIEWIF